MANGSKNDCFLGINLISEIENRRAEEKMEDKSRTKQKKEIKYFSLEHDGEEQRTSVNSKRKKFNKQREGEQIVKRRTESKSKADPLRTVEFTV
jgi:hypothetical protein